MHHRFAPVLLGLVVLVGCSSGSGPGSSAATGSGPSAGPSTAESGWQVDANASNLDGASIYDVIAAGPGFVALGSVSESGHTVAASWTSADGLTWTRGADSPSYIDHLLLRATLYNNTIFAVAYSCSAGSGECGDGAIWTSADGSSWQIGGPVSLGYRILDLRSDSHVMVAVVDNEDTLDGTAFSSTDGQSWTLSPSTSSFAGTHTGAVGFGGPGAVMVGGRSSSPLAWVSSDGSTWTPGTGDFGSGEMRDVAASGAQVVAVGRGDDGAAVWSSANGADWQQEASADALKGGIMDAVAVAGPEFIAVGDADNNAAIWTSPDGLTWTKEELPASLTGAELKSIAVDSNSIVALGTGASAQVPVLVRALTP